MFIHKTEKDNDVEILTEGKLLGKMLEIGVENPLVTHYNWTEEKGEYIVTIDEEEHIFIYSKEIYELRAIFELKDDKPVGLKVVTRDIKSMLVGLSNHKYTEIHELSKHISMFMWLNEDNIVGGDKMLIDLDKIKGILTFYR